MVAQYYRDPSSGNFVPLPTAGDVVIPNEVAISASEPGDLNVEFWVDTDDNSMGDPNPVPIGAIIAFGGPAAPAGWHICDGSAHGSPALQTVLGSANTPDLRGKFILSASATYPRLTTGGAATHTLTLAETPAHTHETADGTHFAMTQAIGQGGSGVAYAAINGWHPSTNSKGGGGAHNNMPPYYVLIYIVKKV